MGLYASEYVLVMQMEEIPISRCGWASGNQLMQAYHDQEWGVPLHDDMKFFEFLVLEGAQAGLSWSTILKKRDNYREAFNGFDVNRVAHYGENDLARLLANSGIVRNRLKIISAINNAQCVLSVREEFGSFDRYVWHFVDYLAVQNSYTAQSQLPARTDQSDIISKDLRRRGFSFVGSTICYAFMQATGIVNDHLTSCFRHVQISQ